MTSNERTHPILRLQIKRFKTILIAFLILFVARIKPVSSEDYLNDVEEEEEEDWEGNQVSKETRENQENASTATREGNEGKTRYWISKFGRIKDDLIDVQAIIVKDEESDENCKIGRRESDKRYLMCAGSILTNGYVLTSANCIHEATHIRHNVQAPLAVIVGPFKLGVQIIRIVDYRVHPHHVANPDNPDHARHNVAILKLACRISPNNYHRVRMPTSPMSETCSQDDCAVIIHRKTMRNSVVIFEAVARYIPLRRRRRSLAGSLSASDFRAHYGNSRDKRKTTTATTASASERGRKRRTQTRLPNEYALSKASRQGNASGRTLVVRSSDGVKGCPQTGTAVMVNGTQAALVSVPCDDRQPLTPWKYTDLYENVDWILATTKDWNSRWSGHRSNETRDGCSTCIFNFFIDYNKNNSDATKEHHENSIKDESSNNGNLEENCEDYGNELWMTGKNTARRNALCSNPWKEKEWLKHQNLLRNDYKMTREKQNTLDKNKTRLQMKKGTETRNIF